MIAILEKYEFNALALCVKRITSTNPVLAFGFLQPIELKSSHSDLSVHEYARGNKQRRVIALITNCGGKIFALNYSLASPTGTATDLPQQEKR